MIGALVEQLESSGQKTGRPKNGKVPAWIDEFVSSHFEPRNNWAEKDICILLPIYKYVQPWTHHTIMCLWDRATMCELPRVGDGMITRSRNILARRFLERTKCTWSLWFDDDLIFPFGDAAQFRYIVGRNDISDEFAGLNTVHRLLGWNKKLVGACYFDRWGKDTVTAGFSKGIPFRIPSHNLAVVDFIGTGCLLVHRQVYLDIAAKFPETLVPGANEGGFFTPIQDKGRMMGEDEAFGWRALQCGHQSHLDVGLIPGHMGEQIRHLPK